MAELNERLLKIDHKRHCLLALAQNQGILNTTFGIDSRVGSKSTIGLESMSGVDSKFEPIQN